MKLLITGGTAIAALKLLKAFENREAVLADYGTVPMLKSAAYQMISLGKKNEEIVAHNILNICLDEGITTVLPLYSFEIIALAKAKVLFSEFGIQILLPDDEALQLYFNESQTPKLNDWAVYDSGKLLYASTDNPVWQTQQNNLNGAFTWASGQPFLITI
ncbi:hypothetical protein VRU48_01920 [Pedobacter sp. KR3-3]|uniref:Uncharacterized protein n=1 Tax=Pedobacter albus TaxID=3113905 RepID=A0ABU7I302_9SPHI|nr:hypothetical protein [Pedobacter sp. KR3-3]MEE1943845.1 hypothetical protein [Pedobacter sp. KR3-3]